MKNRYEFKILEKLDDEDKYKIKYFIRLLVQQEKYNNLKDEIRSRRKEIAQGETLTHDELWASLDV
jgi:hypothetical protein